jgi:uncharacterized protein
MIHLLDINVLIALCDPAHPHAAAARKAFTAELTCDGWATCPLIENGFLRILGSRKYPGGPGSAQAARHLLTGILATPGHQFWPDDLSLTSVDIFPHLPASENITDFYLLALAVKHGGRFATFDRTVPASLLPGGPSAYHVIGT